MHDTISHQSSSIFTNSIADIYLGGIRVDKPVPFWCYENRFDFSDLLENVSNS